MSHKRLSHLLLLAVGIAGVGALGVLIDYARMLAFRALERPEMALRYWGLLVFLCLVAAVYGAALYQYMRISRRIGKNQSFCRENVGSMRAIACLMGAAAGMWAGLMIVFRLLSSIGVGVEMLLFALMCMASAAIGLVAYVLTQLLRRATQLQEDNDLTI